MQFEIKFNKNNPNKHKDMSKMDVSGQFDVLFYEIDKCDKCLQEHKEYQTFKNTTGIVGYNNAVKIAEEIIDRYKLAIFNWSNLTPNQDSELDFLYGEDANNIIRLSKKLNLSFEEALTFEFVKKIVTVKLNNQIYKLKS